MCNVSLSLVRTIDPFHRGVIVVAHNTNYGSAPFMYVTREDKSTTRAPVHESSRALISVMSDDNTSMKRV